jgi:hypothetical protein
VLNCLVITAAFRGSFVCREEQIHTWHKFGLIGYKDMIVSTGDMQLSLETLIVHFLAYDQVTVKYAHGCHREKELSGMTVIWM